MDINNKIAVYKLSSSQSRMFLLSKIYSNSVNFNINRVLHLKGVLDIKLLQKSLNILLKQQGALRASFFNTPDGPVQKIYSSREAKVSFNDLLDIPPKQREVEEEKIINCSINKKFNLENDILFSLDVLKRGENDFVMLLVIHHIVSDGWSMNIFFEELFSVYNDLCNGKKISTQNRQADYIDQITRQSSIVNPGEYDKSKKYWHRRFRDYTGAINLHFQNKTSTSKEHSGGREEIELDKNFSKKIRSVAQSNKTTTFILLYYVFFVFIYKLSGEKDLVAGTPVTERSKKETRNMIGCFMNILSNRFVLDSEKSTKYNLCLFIKAFLEDYKHKDYPVEGMVNFDGVNQNELLNFIFQFDPKSIKDYKLKNIKIISETQKSDVNLFDLRIRASEQENSKILLKCDYNKVLFSREDAKLFLRIYKSILTACISDPSSKIKKINITYDSGESKQRYSGKKIEFPRNKSLVDLFERQAELHPNRHAVEHNGSKISYKELNHRSNQLADYLTKKEKITAGTIIGVALDRSIDYLVAVLAVLKSRGVYLSIVNDSPVARVGYIMKNSNSEIIITSRKYRHRYEEIAKNILCVDDLSEKDIKAYCRENKKRGRSIKDFATIIYTSGSTGNPKGIPLSHKNIIVQIFGIINYLNIKRSQVLCQNLSQSFVASIWQFFAPLVNGNKLIIFDNNISRDIFNLFKEANKRKVSFLEITPSEISLFLSMQSSQEMPNLKSIILTGEKSSQWLVSKYYGKYKVPLVNAYGQAECCDDTLYARIDKTRKGYIPAGKPSFGTEVFILSHDLQIQPIGLPGELYISGDGLARGYINDPEKTNEVFLSHPFKKGKMIYKTGDMAKMHKDGNIEILGRIDHQIKLRGYRIEPGEIEAKIKEYKAIKDTVVIAKEDKKSEGKYLVAYYTSQTNKKINQTNLKKHLNDQLPEYMIPAIFVHLRQMPLNQSGKLDRLILPEPKEDIFSKKKYKAPQTDTEKKLATIWQEVLSVKKIGLNDSFFDLGGHSLKAIQVLSRINKQFSIDLPFKKLFQNSILSELAQCIDSQEKIKHITIKKVLKKDQYPFNAQKRVISDRSGQIDRKNLPEPRDSDLDRKKYVAPQTDTEKKLAMIWQEVLSVKKIGLNDSFFDLGGHSLKAIQVLSRINKQFSIDLPFKKLFQNSILSELAQCIDSQEKIKQITIKKVLKKNYYPLTHAQKRMWVLYQLEPSSPFYNITRVVKLSGKLNIDFLEYGLNKLIKRHEALRTNFEERDGEPVQIIRKRQGNKIRFEDLTGIKEKKARKKAKDKIINNEVREPFNLVNDRLLRLCIIKSGEKDYTFVVVAHHIIADKWSMRLFYRELFLLYNSKLEKRKIKLPVLPIQYKEYALWEQSEDGQKRLKEQESYWLNKLNGKLPILNLPLDKPRPTIQTYRGSRERLELDKETTSKLRRFARQEDVTMFSLIMTIFCVFLYRFTGQEDFIIGTLSANRKMVELNNVMGVFLNILPLRIKLKSNDEFFSLLKRVKTTVIEAAENDDLPFEYLIEKLNLKRDLSRPPIFNVLFQHNDVISGDIVRMNAINSKLMSDTNDTTKFDMELRTTELRSGRMVILIDYNTDLFKKETIKKALNTLKSMMDFSREDKVISKTLLTKNLNNYSFERRRMMLDKSGQIDRRNLPEPKDSDLDRKKYVAPKTDTEKKLAMIWQEVLCVKKISLNDNFFDLGGHSLKAIKLLNLIKKEFKKELKLKDLFLYTEFIDQIKLVNRQKKSHLEETKITKAKGQILPSSR